MTRRAIARSTEIAPVRPVHLQSYAPEVPRGSIPIEVLKASLTQRSDARRAHRRRFGRAISLDRIESALRSAQYGKMRDITDLSRETIDTDPHLASVLQKRFGAVASLPWEVQPASGFGVDKDKALFYAAVVREQLGNLRNFRQTLTRVAWALFDGRSALELKWLAINGMSSSFGAVRLAVDSLAWIHPRRLHFGPSRELQIVDEDYMAFGGAFAASGLSLAEEDLRKTNLWRKFLWWTPQLFGEHPEREGLAPRCLYWSFFKRFSARERMILVELYGKPWRVIEVEQESTAGGDELEAAEEAADGLGGSYTARMPRGTKLNVVQPGKSAGQVHSDIIGDSDRQISKLVLGQIATTDGAPAGLNSNQASVMQDEQWLIVHHDACEISEVIETYLTDAIIELNFGSTELPHAPRFVLRSDLPVDRSAELDRLGKALNQGLEIAVDEAYEVSGFRRPERDETVLRIDQPPTSPLSPAAPAPRSVIVYPANTSPASGEQLPPAQTSSSEEGAKDSSQVTVGSADVSKIMKVNEARAGQGLPPLTLPDGSPDPDGELTIIEFETKKAGKSTEASASSSSSTSGPESGDDGDPTEPKITEPLIVAAIGDHEIALQLVRSVEEHRAETTRWDAFVHSGGHAYCETDHKQPETVLGSPEEIIERGTGELARETRKWANALSAAVEGKSAPADIFNALNRTHGTLGTEPYAQALERRMLQSIGLGALDSELDLEEGDVPEREKLITSAKAGTPNFSSRPFDEALRYFEDKNVITRSQFDRLSSLAKQRAFTVAGLETKQMLRLVHDELAKQISKGADLREFRRFMEKRIKSSGMVMSVVEGTNLKSASHIETVFRTNVLNSYNAGRHAHMTNPEVLKARPIWQISVIRDTRARPAHYDAHGKCLRADDPFWQTAYPPFGFNCRCRVRSLPASKAPAVVSGRVVQGLPDPGFKSGVAALL